MKAESAAAIWGVSPKSVYRLVKDGVLPHSVKPRDKPLTRLEIEDSLVRRVVQEGSKRQINLTPQVIKDIINSF